MNTWVLVHRCKLVTTVGGVRISDYSFLLCEGPAMVQCLLTVMTANNLHVWKLAVAWRPGTGSCSHDQASRHAWVAKRVPAVVAPCGWRNGCPVVVTTYTLRVKSPTAQRKCVDWATPLTVVVSWL
jgi:hypothetical protein